MIKELIYWIHVYLDRMGLYSLELKPIFMIIFTVLEYMCGSHHIGSHILLVGSKTSSVPAAIAILF